MVESLKQSFMDCQLSCTSPLPRIWVIEALAHSNQVDISLLLDLLEKTPEVFDDLGKNARELVSLRILESFLVQGDRANSVFSASSQKISLDPSDDSCEDVLRRILTEISQSHLKPPGPEMSKWDLQPFIEYKRSSLAGYALQQLKNAMLTGRHSILASLKERSGLPDGNEPEHRSSVDEGNCNGITPRPEGTNTNDGDLLQTKLIDENFPVNRKRGATNENARDTPSENLFLLKNGCETHIKSAKKYKHDIICSEQNVEKLRGGDAELTDMSTESLQHSEEKTHAEEIGLNDDMCTSAKVHVGLDEVLPYEKQVLFCDTEVNNKSGEQEPDHDIDEVLPHEKQIPCCDTEVNNISREQEQDHGIEEEKGDRNKSEQHIQRNILYLGEVEEVDISSDTDANNDDMSDIATKDTASVSGKNAHSKDFLGTIDIRGENLSVDTSRRYSEENMCSLANEKDVEVLGHNGPPGESNDMFTSLEDFVSHDEVLPPKKQSPYSTAQCQNEIFDGEERQDHEDKNAEVDKNGSHVPITINEDMDKLQQNANVDEGEENVDVSTDSDGYHDETTNIDTKKKTFLSSQSQCTYSQDSLARTDCRELNLCVKCNLGGELLVCSSDTCSLVIHQRCLGLDAILDTPGEFYCPFCAYSRAISKFMESKKKAALARKDLATLICSGTEKVTNKQSQRLSKNNQNSLEQDDGLPIITELNKSRTKKVRNRQRRKKLEYDQTELSEYNSPFGKKVVSPSGKKVVDTTNKIPHTLTKGKQEMHKTSQVSPSPKAPGQHQMASRAICKSQSGIKSGQVLEGNLHPPETDLPRENKSPQSSQSVDAEETSEHDNENLGASKYFIRVRKQEKKPSYTDTAIPQLRRKRLPWTSKEEDKLKEGLKMHCSPHDKIIPWKTILDHGAGVFHQSRSAIDLKDKWRNMCKATPKSK